MRHITEKQLDILQAISRYKYQTPSHLLKLGIQTHRKNINNTLLRLKSRSRPLIKTIHGHVTQRFGRVENMYYLTKWGKDLLINERRIDPHEIKMPTEGATHFTSDYMHRKGTIDFAIVLDQWADLKGAEVIYFDTYYDTQGNNRIDKNLRARTKIDLPRGGYIIPDAIFMIELHDLTYKLFAFELHNGKDTKRAVKQLRKHAEALSCGSIAKVAEDRTKATLRDDGFLFNKSWRVLFVFENQSIMEATMKRIDGLGFFEPFVQHFVFKTLDNIKRENFTTNWFTCRGDIIEIC